MVSLFERLSKGRSRQNENPKPKERRLELEKIQIDKKVEKLRNWIVNYWSKPTISVREICIYGPNSTRNGKIAQSLVENLVEQGWLIPIKGRRRDMREWQIVPKTNKSLFLKLIGQQQQT